MKIIAFAGSLRTSSLNKRLARECVRLLGASSASAEFIDLRDYPMPLYDGDLEQESGIPQAVSRLALRIGDADGLIVASPEYNGGMSSVLKNAVDWLSRVKPMPLAGKHLLLLSASPGAWGGVRGLWHSRVPFEALGVHVFPEMMSLPAAGSAFDEDGHLNGDRGQQLHRLVTLFASHFGASTALRAA